MPAGIAKTINCPICSVSGRSDNIKQHVRTIHKGVVPVGWFQSSNPKVIYKTIHLGRSMERQMGVCLDCGITIYQSHETAGDLSLFDDHVCKPKQQRSDSSDTSEASEASEAPEPVTASDIFDEIMIGLQKIKVPADKIHHKAFLVNLFRENEQTNTDEGVTDYGDTLIQSVLELVREVYKRSPSAGQ